MGLWHRHAWVAYLAVFLGVVGHGSSEFAAVKTGVAGPELSVWRFLLGGLGLVLLAVARSDSRDLLLPVREQPLRMLWLSAVGITVGYLLFHWALDFATVPQVATMVTTIPIFVGLSNRLLHGEAFTLAKAVTGVAALAGVGLLLTDGYLTQLAGSASTLPGVLMALGCAAAVGVYSVAVRPAVAQYGALRITALTMIVGAIGLWLLVGVAWGDWVNPATLFQRPAPEVTAILVLALFNTTATQFLWIGGLAAVPDITRGSYLFFLKPVIAALLTLAFLEQPVTPMSVLAMLIICSAVFVEPLWSRARRKPVSGQA